MLFIERKGGKRLNLSLAKFIEDYENGLKVTMLNDEVFYIDVLSFNDVVSYRTGAPNVVRREWGSETERKLSNFTPVTHD